jgi:hypothetical protein
MLMSSSTETRTAAKEAATRLQRMDEEADGPARGLYRQAAVMGASMTATFGICCTQPLYLALVVYVAVVGGVGSEVGEAHPGRHPDISILLEGYRAVSLGVTWKRPLRRLRGDRARRPGDSRRLRGASRDKSPPAPAGPVVGVPAIRRGPLDDPRPSRDHQHCWRRRRHGPQPRRDWIPRRLPRGPPRSRLGRRPRGRPPEPG